MAPVTRRSWQGRKPSGHFNPARQNARPIPPRRAERSACSSLQPFLPLVPRPPAALVVKRPEGLGGRPPRRGCRPVRETPAARSASRPAFPSRLGQSAPPLVGRQAGPGWPSERRSTRIRRASMIVGKLGSRAASQGLSGGRRGRGRQAARLPMVARASVRHRKPGWRRPQLPAGGRGDQPQTLSGPGSKRPLSPRRSTGRVSNSTPGHARPGDEPKKALAGWGPLRDPRSAPARARLRPCAAEAAHTPRRRERRAGPHTERRCVRLPVYRPA